MMNAETCPMCAITMALASARLTQWFYHGKSVTVIEDLNSKQYDMRLLAIPSTHFHCDDSYFNERERTVEIAMHIARAVCEDYGFRVEHLDMDRHSFQEHWHLQICLRRL